MAYRDYSLKDRLYTMTSEDIKEYFDDWKALVKEQYITLREAGITEEDKKHLLDSTRKFERELKFLINPKSESLTLHGYKIWRKNIISNVVKEYDRVNDAMVYALDKYGIN